MRRQDLVNQFKKIGLKLKITSEPIGRTSNSDVFQMDIGRKISKTRRTEWFEIWPGKDTKIQILDIDHKLNQLLLLIQEPERVFEVEERKKRYRHKTIEEAIADRKEEFRRENLQYKETKTSFIIFRKTTPLVRHYLMGVDERQLFVAQLIGGASTVNAARKSLGSSVQFHEGVRKMTPKRQGEWFFIKATRKQEEYIDLLLQKNKIWIEHKANIGQYNGHPSGNPHVADELVIIPQDPRVSLERIKESKFKRGRIPIKEGKYPVRSREVYVRGKVRHIDHKTVKYQHWYQVLLNNEGDTASATETWID